MLPEQISRAGYSVVLGLHPLPAPFLFHLPVSWGGGRVWVLPDHNFATLPFSMRSSLFPKCRQTVVVFPVILSGLVVFAIFSYYMWFWEEVSVSSLTLLPLSQSLTPLFFLSLSEPSRGSCYILSIPLVRSI